jgi:hypothetical protein
MSINLIRSNIGRIQKDIANIHKKVSDEKKKESQLVTKINRILGVKVWYDEFSLKVGDSLRQSIDKGLADSKYGVVVISTSFIKGNWPQYEVNGLVAREMEGAKVILPIWHKVAKSDVIKYSPTLADKVALNSSILDIPEIAKRLSEVL